jgi:hypothetical protein
MNHWQLRALWIWSVVLLVSCSSIGRPTVTQLTISPPIFLLAYPLTFSAGDGAQQFSVPPGFVTDLASIPRTLWWWQAPHEGTMAPAIVHDFLYWEQPCTKDEADAVIYVAMKQAGMKDGAIELVYGGVRTPIGQAAWDKNKAARARGEARFFSSKFSIFLASGNLDPKSTLATIQAEAGKRNGAVTPTLPLPTIRAVCQAAFKEYEALRTL